MKKKAIRKKKAKKNWKPSVVPPNPSPAKTPEPVSITPLPSEFIAAMERINPRLVGLVLANVFSGGLTRRVGLWDKARLDGFITVIHGLATDWEFVSSYRGMVEFFTGKSKEPSTLSNAIVLLAVFHAMVGARGHI